MANFFNFFYPNSRRKSYIKNSPLYAKIYNYWMLRCLLIADRRIEGQTDGRTDTKCRIEALSQLQIGAKDFKHHA